jgi:riboflavin kinase/FMN adenylyltransferase
MSITKIHSLEELSKIKGSISLAIGMFDGVHLGHQEVLQSCISFASQSNASPAVLTFWPHPSHLFRPEDPTKMLQSIEFKERFLESLGIEYVIEIEFTKDFAAISADDFLPLIQKYLPSLNGIFVGENFRYGKKRSGTVDLLKEQGVALGIQVFGQPRKLYQGEPISSSRIRKELAKGNIVEVNAMLGRPYKTIGTVIRGKQLGRTIGFATLNLSYNPESKPAFGVYSFSLSSLESNHSYRAVGNYGLRPTVENDVTPILEIHVLGDVCPFDYGDEVDVKWETFIRPEMKFESVELLKLQIQKDIEKIQK